MGSKRLSQKTRRPCQTLQREELRGCHQAILANSGIHADLSVWKTDGLYQEINRAVLSRGSGESTVDHAVRLYGLDHGSSNPEGRQLQETGHPPVWLSVLDEIAHWSAANNNTRTVGAVVGATKPSDLQVALERLPAALFLAPGIGKQGASTAELAKRGLELDRVIVSSSRGVAENGPGVDGLKTAIASLAEAS